jgi:hypothetical protein
LNFSRGLSEPDEPALSVRDLTGRLRAWIRLERRMQFDLSVTERHLFVSIRGATLSGAVERLALAA